MKRSLEENYCISALQPLIPRHKFWVSPAIAEMPDVHLEGMRELKFMTGIFAPRQSSWGGVDLTPRFRKVFFPSVFNGVL